MRQEYNSVMLIYSEVFDVQAVPFKQYNFFYTVYVLIVAWCWQLLVFQTLESDMYGHSVKPCSCPASKSSSINSLKRVTDLALTNQTHSTVITLIVNGSEI